MLDRAGLAVSARPGHCGSITAASDPEHRVNEKRAGTPGCQRRPSRVTYAEADRRLTAKLRSFNTARHTCSLVFQRRVGKKKPQIVGGELVRVLVGTDHGPSLKFLHVLQLKQNPFAHSKHNPESEMRKIRRTAAFAIVARCSSGSRSRPWRLVEEVARRGVSRDRRSEQFQHG